MKKAKFIVIEGGEGAGKTAQLKALKEIYGDQVVLTREPGGSPYAEEIRNVILKSPHAGQADARTHFALFWAARADHLKNTISPALEAGKSVISDRFDSSTFAYQIFGQEAKDLLPLFWPMRDFILRETKPDLYIYLDVNEAEGLRRKSGQGADEQNHFDERALDFHRRMREGMMEFFKTVPHEIVDANPPFEVVKASLRVILDRELL